MHAVTLLRDGINTPSINIRYDWLNILLNTYRELQKDYFGRFYLLEEKKINFPNFKIFIQKLAENENNHLQNILTIRKNQQRKYQRIFNDLPKQINISKKNYLEVVILIKICMKAVNY